MPFTLQTVAIDDGHGTGSTIERMTQSQRLRQMAALLDRSCPSSTYITATGQNAGCLCLFFFVGLTAYPAVSEPEPDHPLTCCAVCDARTKPSVIALDL
uniref:Uncharacterized protein n=1 Tax=Anopheles minimus TaxID=112268 RepID=A0A182VQG3_9DIPT